ncbi:MAG: helix-turn-helix domain-containing protein [Bacteroidetes bacterium]|nr:helix-turn-helix domain-containing protein [Bacteroidota bacterium]
MYAYLLSWRYIYASIMGITDIISKNIKRIRHIKKLSQKEVAIASNIPQGQFSRIENGRVEPLISSLEKLASVFEVSISEFFKTNSKEEEINMPLLEKIKLIDELEGDERKALLKMIDIAISKKKMKDNLSDLLKS